MIAPPHQGVKLDAKRIWRRLWGLGLANAQQPVRRHGIGHAFEAHLVHLFGVDL
jgi:hypothetical protein